MSLENNNQPLPSPDAIDVGMASMEADVAEMFGLGETSAEPAVQAGETPPQVSPPAVAPTEPAGGGEQAPSSPAEPSPAAPAATPAPTAPEGQPAPATPPAAPPADGAPTAPPAAPPSSDEQTLKVHSLEATVEALTAQIAALQASPVAPAQPEPGTESGRPEDQLPAYRLTLPQPVGEAILDAENPQRQMAGITHMMNSLATIVHHNVRLEMRGMLGGLMQAAREQEAVTTRSTEVEQGRAQYYEAFPQHNSELILPLIQAEARGMAAEFPNLRWDADYINALGTRVNNRIAALSGQPPAPVVTPPATPAATLPTGTRADAPPGTQLEGEDLIWDTFS